MLEAGLVCSRFIHFTCAIVLFGVALFGLYSRLSECRSERLACPLSASLLAAALCALPSGFAWFLSTVGNMSGTLAGAFDREALRSVLWDTGFGLVWAARFEGAVVAEPSRGLRQTAMKPFADSGLRHLRRTLFGCGPSQPARVHVRARA